MASPKHQVKGGASAPTMAASSGRLAEATTRYYEALSSQALAEERALTEWLQKAAEAIDVDSGA